MPERRKKQLGRRTSRRRRRLGQHFLTNPRLADKIVSLAGVTNQDTVLEIGPGKGILTEALLKTGCQVITVEKDASLANSLQSKYAENDRVQIYSADFLNIDLPKLLASDASRITLHESRAKVVANLPYSIATEIIFRLIDSREYFSELYVMVQREVAQRLVAKPGKKDYGILSVLTQLYSESRILLKVPPGAFSPPPKVDSAVVAMKLSQQPRVDVKDVELFKTIVRAAFATRRKMLRNALQGSSKLTPPVGMTWEDLLKSVGIDEKARAEVVLIKQFSELANQITSSTRQD